MNSDLFADLEQYRQQERKLLWQGTFRDYVALACANPKIARLSHARVYDMITSCGIEVSPSGQKTYGFFDDELFGIEKPVEQLAEYFSSAAQRLEVRKRILMLMGPVGAGKSSLVTLIKHGMEAYSRTEEGAAYAIHNCPMHEEPLHLVPEELRPQLEKQYGLYIEGELCPRCRMTVHELYNDKVEDVLVDRIAFSEKHRVGIGTFTPNDEKGLDIADLTGSIDLATVGQYGSESDPRAYRFDGELNIANRGVLELVEMLKVPESFLYALLTLSQEQNIKTSRFAMIYADEAILAHTNENEFVSFIGNKKSEALQDRIIVIRVPYNLKVSEEIKIYDKLLKQSNILSHVHIAPYTLRISSIFAILSRLEPSKKEGMTTMHKLKLYDGEDTDNFTVRDVKELQAETIREGMDGISPRYVINSISRALAREQTSCINPIDALRALRDGLDQHPGLSRERRDELLNLISETRKEYDDIAKNEVQKAFVYSFEESARTLLNNYLDNVEAFCNKTKIKDPITEEEIEADENLMKSIEEQIGVNESSKKTFREEILIRLSALARRQQTFSYTSHERLKEAIEKKLFADLKDVVKITTSTRTPDEEQLRRINGVVDRLVASHGFCHRCANELLRYVGTLLSR